MSDAAQGSGWWQASDGKWYSPDLHPGIDPEANPDLSGSAASEARATNPGAPPVWPTPDLHLHRPADESAPETIRVDMPPSFFRDRDLKKSRVRLRSTQPSLEFDASDDAASHAGLTTDLAALLDASASSPGVAPPTEWGQASAPLTGRSATGPGGFTHGGTDEHRTAMRSYLDPTVAATYREPPPEPDVAAGVWGILAAAGLVLGSFLTWANASGPVDGSVGGMSGSNGLGTLLCGLAIAALGALVLTGRRSALVGALMLAAALGAVVLAGYSAVDIIRTDDELARELIAAGIGREEANAASLRLAGGFAVVAVSAAVGLIAAMIAFARRT